MSKHKCAGTLPGDMVDTVGSTFQSPLFPLHCIGEIC